MTGLQIFYSTVNNYDAVFKIYSYLHYFIDLQAFPTVTCKCELIPFRFYSLHFYSLEALFHLTYLCYENPHNDLYKLEIIW